MSLVTVHRSPVVAATGTISDASNRKEPGGLSTKSVVLNVNRFAQRAALTEAAAAPPTATAILETEKLAEIPTGDRNKKDHAEGALWRPGVKSRPHSILAARPVGLANEPGDKMTTLMAAGSREGIKEAAPVTMRRKEAATTSGGISSSFDKPGPGMSAAPHKSHSFFSNITKSTNSRQLSAGGSGGNNSTSTGNAGGPGHTTRQKIKFEKEFNFRNLKEIYDENKVIFHLFIFVLFISLSKLGKRSI